MTDVPFPVLQARTARFTLGRPRGFAVAPDGSRIAFLRSRGGTDRVNCLWVYDVATRGERLIADPVVLLTSPDPALSEKLPATERARRERAREQAGGIVAYSTDPAVSMATFALSGKAFVADLVAGTVATVDARGPVFDPRIDPTRRHLAYVRSGTLRVTPLDPAGRDFELAAEDGVSWGVAEFVAAEEMNRHRGFWWAPDGESLLVARVDESSVEHWHIGDPANPDRAPATIAYPAAGTANADVSLWLVRLDGARTEVDWDTSRFPYLVAVRWKADGLLVQVASRDQKTMQYLEIEVPSGSATVLAEDRDEHWLEVVGGVPDRLPDGRLVRTVDIDDARRLIVGDRIVSPPGLQVRAVLALSPDDILFSASSDPMQQHLWGSFGPDHECVCLTSTPGVHSGTGASDVLVVTSASLSTDGTRTVVRQNGVEIGEIASYAEPAPFVPSISISRQGARELATALVLPSDYIAGSRTLPVLMDPYGGPHAQRVTASRSAYLNAQWLADQGFAVVIADGRGSPGRGPAWERAIAGDLATPVLDDQIDALHALAATNADLDLSRVAIRGWSFGGYLAALAVLRRPDVFHAAVAGAPVTDWRLYDTYYTERYLGVDASSAVYDRSSLIDDAPSLTRPLLIVHGLADDNVVAAHTLRLSSALLAAGRPHSVLPLSGVTHMTPQEVVAANLLRLEVAFLRDALRTVT
ncbi:MAG: prolyl oligopeptidase family serine peptidase [Acidothermaceae bacterium]